MSSTTSVVIANGQVLLPTGEFVRGDISIKNGLITEIGNRCTGAQRFDAREGYVVPGLIDLHLHGLGLFSLEEGTLAELAALEAAQGTTRFYPTLFGSPEQIIEQLVRHRRETDELLAVPQIGGFRLESPYLANTGAGIAENLAPISPALTERLLKAGGGSGQYRKSICQHPP